MKRLNKSKTFERAINNNLKPVLLKAIFAFVFLSAGSILPNSSYAAGNSDCDDGIMNNAKELVSCINQPDLWKHLVKFQEISDNNIDHTFDGFAGGLHGSRDPGSPGDLASVNYIVKKMKGAGYNVSVQSYEVPYSADHSLPALSEQTPAAVSYTPSVDFASIGNSGTGNINAQLQAVGGIILPPTAEPSSQSGCSAADFAGFVSGRIALIQRGGCTFETKAQNAQDAGAAGVIVFNEGNPGRTSYFTGSMANAKSIPVLSVTYAIGLQLYNQMQNGPVIMKMKTDVISETRTTYNVIADSRYGDPNHIVVADAHYDSIYGAGILDNASGSATMLEIALKMKNTPTRSKLRFIWFGGEELGILGSDYYTVNLTEDELSKIVFDVDANVTATQNYVISIADPAGSGDVDSFPPNVVPDSQLGNNYFIEYFNSIGMPYQLDSNDGTDSISFAYSGIPNTGILTEQDCCKTQALVDIFGGYLGNFEGNVSRGIPLNIVPPNFDGGCVDNPYVFCDNINNTDPKILTMISKATAYVVYKLANDRTLNPNPIHHGHGHHHPNHHGHFHKHGFHNDAEH